MKSRVSYLCHNSDRPLLTDLTEMNQHFNEINILKYYLERKGMVKP